MAIARHRLTPGAWLHLPFVGFKEMTSFGKPVCILVDQYFLSLRYLLTGGFKIFSFYMPSSSAFLPLGFKNPECDK